VYERVLDIRRDALVLDNDCFNGTKEDETRGTEEVIDRRALKCAAVAPP
jgi:hypothetical protein